MIVTNRFGQLIEAVRGLSREADYREAVTRIGHIMWRSSASKQPVGQPDSWDRRTTASERLGHTPIRQGWGMEVVSTPNSATVSLQNISEHIKFFLWSVGRLKRPYLGTKPHRIPVSGTAKGQYGHALAWWWWKYNRPEFRSSWVDHPGTMDNFGERDFVQQAYDENETEITGIAREAVRLTLVDRLRRIW